MRALLLAALLPFVVSGGHAPPLPWWVMVRADSATIAATLDHHRPGLSYVVTMPLDSSRGYILKAHRLAFGPLMADGSMSQADLAGLSHVSATKISRVERGLDTLTSAQQDSIALAFIRIMRARVNPAAMEQFNAVVLRNMSRQ